MYEPAEGVTEGTAAAASPRPHIKSPALRGEESEANKMSKRKFVKLRAAMYEAEITQADIARELGKCYNYISARMTGREPFNVDEVRQIGTLLHIDRSQWLDYFMEGA